MGLMMDEPNAKKKLNLKLDIKLLIEMVQQQLILLEKFIPQEISAKFYQN